jgi:hypothetical protein
LYPGTKRGLEAEFENFRKQRNKVDTVKLLLPALKKEIEYKNNLRKAGKFVPEWKNLSTWINQKCWTQEFQPVNGVKHDLEPAKGLER